MLTITYNPKHDLRNWIRLAKSDGAKFTLTHFYPFDRNIPLDERNADKILATLPAETTDRFLAQARQLELEWINRERLAIEAISKFLHLEPRPMTARASLTTTYRMPYDVQDRWFMIPTHKDRNQQLRVVLHELFHLYHLEKRPQATTRELEQTAQQFLESQSLLLAGGGSGEGKENSDTLNA